MPSVGVRVVLGSLPFLGMLAIPWGGYDVGVIRASVMLGELVAIGLLAPEGAVGRAWRAAPTWVQATLGVWIGAQVVTTATAVHIGPAVFRTAEWATHLAFGIALWDWIGGQEERARGVVGAVAVGALSVCGIWAAVWLSGLSKGVEIESITLPLFHVRFLGFYAMAAVAFGLGIRPERRGLPSAVWHIGWGLAWAVLCWSGGRGSLGATVLAVGLWAALARPGWRESLIAAATAAAGAVVSLGLPTDERWMGLARFFRQTLASGGDFTSERDLLWRHLLDVWATRPWVGLGGDGPAFALVSTPHAHNTAIQALAEWGTVGAAAFGLLLIVVTLRSVGAARASSRAPGAAAAFWVAASVNGLLDGLFYGADTLAMLAVATAVLMPAAERSALTAEPPSLPHVPRRWRQAVVLSALALAPLVFFATHYARFAGGTPEPSSLRARIALAAPLSDRSTEVLWWSKDWTRTHPDAALRAARWGQAHSRTPWAFWTVEGDLWAASGDAARAEACWLRAGREREAAPVTTR